MLKQYKILNMCLETLNSSGLPAVKKLKLEIQLIHIKRVLLNNQVEYPVGGDDCKQVFYDLHESFHRVCNSTGTYGETDRLILLCLNIRNDLESKLKLHSSNYPESSKGVLAEIVSNFKARS